MKKHFAAILIVVQMLLLYRPALAVIPQDQWPEVLRSKQAAFSPAYQLIKQKKFAEALPILQQNIATHPNAPTLDYEYVWAFVCLAELGRFKDMEDYYKLILERGYNGEVIDSSTELKRNWKERIYEAHKAFILHLEAPGAHETLRQLAKLEATYQKPEAAQRGPFSVTYSAHRRLAEYSLVDLSIPGRNWHVAATREQLSLTPLWTARTAPPLSLSQAAKAAADELARRGMKAPIESISLRYLNTRPDTTLPDRWYYVVTFGEMAKKKPVPMPDTSIYLLMDGTILGPKNGTHVTRFEDE